VPPCCSIASLAEPENLCALTVNFFSRLPVPRILIPAFSFFTSPVSTNSSGVTSVPLSKRFKALTFTIAYSLRLTFVKPRLGILLNNVNFPHSKVSPTLPQECDFCQLLPRSDVLPLPDDIPRTTLLRLLRAPSTGLSSCNFIFAPPISFYH